MSGDEVIESFENAWRALCQQYTVYPDESVRCGLNMLSKIIDDIKREYARRGKPHQITINEWLESLKEHESEGV